MKKGAMHEEKLPLWVKHIIAFFHLPNPRIFTLFTISSIVTFSLGIAMVVELVLHGEHHPGYAWIGFYAPLTIALPVSMWIICIISALFLPYKDQNVDAVLPSADQQSKREQEVQGQQPKEHAFVSLAQVVSTRNVVEDNSSLERTFSLPISKTPATDTNLKRSQSCSW